MNKKIILLVIVIIIVIMGIIVGLHFLGKATNRTTSKEKVTAMSAIPGYSVQFAMTQPFADFLYDRGVWNASSIRILKQKPPETAAKALITLKDRDFYKGTKGTNLPVTVSSSVEKSLDGKENTYHIDVFLDTSQIAKYSGKDLSKIVFLSVMSQIYEDTASSETSYSGVGGKLAYLTKIADQPGSSPLSIKKIE